MSAVAGDFEKSTTYFNNTYGLPEKTTTVLPYDFRNGDSVTSISGRFSVRRYRGRNLQVETVFKLPTLTVSAVTVSQTKQWSVSEFEAELNTYGTRWRRVTQQGYRSWEGVRATFHHNAIHFISPEIAGTDRRANREKTASQSPPRK